jgi:hypothetical protein
MGIAFIISGPNLATHMPVLVFVIIALIPVWRRIRKTITYPRVGYVNLSSRPQRRLRVISWMLIILGCVVFFAVALYLFAQMVMHAPPALKTLAQKNIPAAFGLTLAGFAASFAFFAGIRRGYGYALIILAAFFTVIGLDLPNAIAFYISGAAFIIWGLVMLQRFVRKYPVQAEPPIPGETDV